MVKSSQDGDISKTGILWEELCFSSEEYSCVSPISITFEAPELIISSARITAETSTAAIYGYESLLALGAGSSVQAGYTIIYCFIKPEEGADGISWISLGECLCSSCPDDANLWQLNLAVWLLASRSLAQSLSIKLSASCKLSFPLPIVRS